MHRTIRTLGLGLLLLAANPSPAGPPPLPFQGRVTAVWDNIFLALVDPPATFTGGGPVTHMGNTRQAGSLVLEAPIGPGVFPGYGSVTITAANGDKVMFDYVGVLDALTGEGVGTFTFTGGTGRFAGATGGGTFDAQIDVSKPANQPMTVVLDGKISY
jgi:hypothetical protein